MTETSTREWPAQWLRGALPLCVLRIVADEGPLHGYVIAQSLEHAGLGAIGGGTLYPLLGRFERDGLVTTDWVAGENGPAKKVYTVTEQGSRYVATEAARWAEFSEITTRAISGAQTKEREHDHVGER